MEANTISSLIKAFGIPQISESRRYWLVRSNAGAFYQDFTANNFIAIGYDKLDYEILKNYNGSGASEIKLRENIATLYSTSDKPGSIVSMINYFLLEIKPGDIILSPSENSEFIAFGQVCDDSAHFLTDDDINKMNEEPHEIVLCQYKKRRKVNWLKFVSKDMLDLKLAKAFYAHNAVSNIDKYGSVIDRTLNPFFVKNNEIHFKFDINTNDKIAARTHLELLSSFCILCEEFNSFGDENITCDFDDIQLKVQAESKGLSELISIFPEAGAAIAQNLHVLPTVLIIGLAYCVLFGGKISFLGFKFDSDGGAIQKIINWANSIREHKTDGLKEFEKACTKLDATATKIEIDGTKNDKTKKSKER